LTKVTKKTGTGFAKGTCVTTLYQHGNFKGWKVSFSGVRDWRHADYLKKGAKNDDVSAIKVEGKGCVATLYQHDINGGWKASFPEGTYNMKAFLARGAKNDDMSSLRVRRSKIQITTSQTVKTTMYDCIKKTEICDGTA
jgi:hypothetical protein